MFLLAWRKHEWELQYWRMRQWGSSSLSRIWKICSSNIIYQPGFQICPTRRMVLHINLPFELISCDYIKIFRSTIDHLSLLNPFATFLPCPVLLEPPWVRRIGLGPISALLVGSNGFSGNSVESNLTNLYLGRFMYTMVGFLRYIPESVESFCER